MKVNENGETSQASILKVLRYSGNRFVSGETISRETGISRVAVWKHIQDFKDRGYTVETTSKGYRLSGKEDFLFPWEFGGREKEIQYFERLSSTMDEARKLVFDTNSPFKVVLADSQDRGRGRNQRTWVSKHGGLYFTLVTRPAIPMEYAPMYLMHAAITTASILEREYSLQARIKWPNDIIVDGKKIAGILTELGGEMDRIQYLNLGIGININNPPPAVDKETCSVSSLIGKTVPRKIFLASFLQELQNQPVTISDETVSRWKSMSSTIGRQVTIQTGSGTTGGTTVRGTAVDITRAGSLVVRTLDNKRIEFAAGECTYE
jgi:BirA family biotin operon repressor/biotin-[acetyl-CoA-carboxylase] ligase